MIARTSRPGAAEVRTPSPLGQPEQIDPALMAQKVAHVRREARKGQPRSHECHARGCSKQVPPAYFMCARHWRMVPRRLQLLVWQHYNPGQEKGDAGVTEEYCRVTDEAIAAVAVAEGSAR